MDSHHRVHCRQYYLQENYINFKEKLLLQQKLQPIVLHISPFDVGVNSPLPGKICHILPMLIFSFLTLYREILLNDILNSFCRGLSPFSQILKWTGEYITNIGNTFTVTQVDSIQIFIWNLNYAVFLLAGTTRLPITKLSSS